MRSMSPRSISSRAISAASMVFPTPTSSAMSSRTVSCLSAISSGTNWYARGVTEICPNPRKGPAPRLIESSSASRSSRAPSCPERCFGDGCGNVASVTGTGSIARLSQVVSSSEPESGLTLIVSAVLPVSTIHSRPRARTRLPGENVVVISVPQNLRETSERVAPCALVGTEVNVLEALIGELRGVG